MTVLVFCCFKTSSGFYPKMLVTSRILSAFFVSAIIRLIRMSAEICHQPPGMFFYRFLLRPLATLITSSVSHSLIAVTDGASSTSHQNAETAQQVWLYPHHVGLWKGLDLCNLLHLFHAFSTGLFAERVLMSWPSAPSVMTQSTERDVYIPQISRQSAHSFSFKIILLAHKRTKNAVNTVSNHKWRFGIRVDRHKYKLSDTYAT